MALAITIVVTLVLLLLSLIGYWRDIRRGVLAIAGTLLGAILAGFWGQQWGQALAQRFVGGDPRTLTFVVNCVLFLFCALVVGYGGGLLLGRAQERTPFSRRLTGALLGLLNGALIIGYVLRFATAQQPESGFATTVNSTLLARIFHDGLPLLFLGIAIVVGVLVLLRGVVVAIAVGRAAPAPQLQKTPPAQGQGPAKSQPTTSGRVDDRGILDKINKT
jgi:uncharacterized membrane protein required for colicin V production/Na+-transporting methylmalonyl-CoA/oxaloacetate decarboxylase gamma subunit